MATETNFASSSLIPPACAATSSATTSARSNTQRRPERRTYGGLRGERALASSPSLPAATSRPIRSARLSALSWSTSQWIYPGLLVRAAAASSDAFPGRGDGSSSSSSGEQREADELAAKFMQFVSETQQDWPSTERRPTALLPPTAVVKTLMDSLMRNDWPDTDSGLQTAFNFSMPQDANDMLPGAALVTAVRAWDAAERYLKHRDFEQLLKEPMYAPLVNCNAWEFHSPMTFHRPADSSALQAVRVRFNRPDSSEERELTYTFILERVSTGPFKGCWMVVGLRVGDYANV